MLSYFWKRQTIRRDENESESNSPKIVWKKDGTKGEREIFGRLLSS